MTLWPWFAFESGGGVREVPAEGKDVVVSVDEEALEAVLEPVEFETYIEGVKLPD